MSFKIRISGFFVMNVLLIVLAIIMAFVDYFYPSFRNGFLHYSFLVWTLIALIRSISYYKPIYFAITKKTILTVNDEYIDDFISGIRYYWRDIREIYEKDAYLRILFYQPRNHLMDITNPFRRFFAKSSLKSNTDSTPFSINMDIIDVHPDFLLQLLNDYSIQAEDKR